MSLQIQENLFSLSKDTIACPRTPTLPGIQEGKIERKGPVKHRNLQIITSANTPRSPSKTNTTRRLGYSDFPIRKNLFNEIGKPSEPLSSKLPREISSQVSYRSFSTSAQDKGGKYLNEINNLNNKIRNLIKEQDSLRDKLVVQENIISTLHKDNAVRPVVGYHEIQSATLLQEDSIDDSYFHVTFKPNEKWVQPRSKRFPREVFCKVPKNRLSC